LLSLAHRPDNTVGAIVALNRTSVRNGVEMALTRAAWRSQVRNELGDGGGTPLWADGLLDAWLVEAIRDYGRHFPREGTATLTTVAGTSAYTLPADLVELVRVEHPVGTFRVRQARVGGEWRAAETGDRAVRAGWWAYDVWGTTLELEPPPTVSGEAIALRYVARRAEPTADSSVLDVEDGDEALLSYYACARALEWIGAQEAKRQAFERERGAAADATARGYAQRYGEGLAARRRQARPRQRRLVPRDGEGA
jgi:hypothetical protein